jgi:hypothetical protein
MNQSRDTDIIKMSLLIAVLAEVIRVSEFHRPI